MRSWRFPGSIPARATVPLLGALLLLTNPEGTAVAAAEATASPICTGFERPLLTPSEYYTIPLVRTTGAPGATGVVRVRFASSPFGVAVTEDGRYLYDIHLSASGLRTVAGRTYVAWITTPNLDEVVRLGPLDGVLEVSGRVEWNKYLVVVSAETSEAGERWAGPIVLRGLSLSGMLESMNGHGPLDTEECYYMGYQSAIPL